MKLKKIILASSSIVGLGLIVPSAIRANNNTNLNQIKNFNKGAVPNYPSVVKPTTSTLPIKFTGINYAGTYKKPEYANTTIQLYDFNDKPINKPESDLSNWPYGSDSMYIGLTLNEGYVWSDYTDKPIQIKYTVSGLPKTTTKIAKPTTLTAPVAFTGYQGKGTYKKPEYANTTVQLYDFNDKPINKPESDLSNFPYGSDDMYIGYTPNNNYAWNDGTNKMVKIKYVVKNLVTQMKKPTSSTAAVTIIGYEGHGSYKEPQYPNTTIQLFDWQGIPIKNPPTNLSNYPYYTGSFCVGYTPNKGYTWTDGTNYMTLVHYKVEGLRKYPIPSLNNNQFHYVKGSEPHDHYDYYLGIGYNDLKTLVGRTFEYLSLKNKKHHNAGNKPDPNDVHQHHSADSAPGISSQAGKHQKLLEYYFNTAGASDYVAFSVPMPRFSEAFDNDMNGVESRAFGDNNIMNVISYGSQWETAYKNHEGIIIHYTTAFPTLFHIQIDTSATIQAANQSAWNDTFDC